MRIVHGATVVATLLAATIVAAAVVGCGGGDEEDAAADGSNSSPGSLLEQITKGSSAAEADAAKHGGGTTAVAADARPGTPPARSDEEPPTFPGSVRVHSLRIASTGREVKAPENTAMFLHTSQDDAEVMQWYEQQLLAEGWLVAERLSEAGGDAGIAFNKGRRTLTLTVGSLPPPKPEGHEDKELLIVVHIDES